jgi:hypothetical protein
MSYRNFGTGVSQTPQNISAGDQFSGEDRAYETVVIKSDAPVIDWEQNLRTGVSNDFGYITSNQRSLPSCWLTGDFSETPDISGSYVFLAPVVGSENRFRLRSSFLQVNGWTINFEFSGTSTSGLNEIVLPAPPGGATRSDLVILEVWRALISVSPSVTNKSATGLILRHGNVKAPDAVNLTDDLIDPNFLSESSKRVQIQYRYRVITGVNADTFPDGFGDPLVVANTVSDFTGPGADGSATILAYAQHPNDHGLWIAGTGSAANATTLGTVDGFMYAIPISFVFRRNTTAFSRTLNMNGGSLVVSAASTRPDGLFVDQIVIDDIKDLRKTVNFDSFQFLQKGTQQLLDNSLPSNHETVSGAAGTAMIIQDSTDVGQHIGATNYIRTKFSDRAVTEQAVLRFDVPGVATPSVAFAMGALPIAHGTATDVVIGTPGTFNSILSITSASIPAGGNDVMVFGAGVNDISSIVMTPTTLTINFNTTAPLLRALMVWVTIDYPSNIGLERNIVDEHQVWTPNSGGGVGQLPIWADAAQLSPAPVPSDALRSNLVTSRWTMDRLHRELTATLITTDQTITWPTSNTNDITIPDRVDSIVSLNGGALAPGAITVNTAYTTISFAPAVVPPAGITVIYKAIRPFPNVAGGNYHVFTQSRAIQSLDVPAGNQTIRLIPRAILNEMVVITVGSGSSDFSYPYTAPSTQISVASTPGANFPEALLDSASLVEIAGAQINTGFLQLGTIVPYSPSANEVVLERLVGDSDLDSEGRHFWARGSTSFYLPAGFAPPLVSGKRHKTAFFALMELSADYATIGRKGTILLVAFSKFHTALDAKNDVTMLTVPSDSGASLYRLRGNILNPRRMNA